MLHEVDVIAEQNNMVLIVECKYHNSSGGISDVKAPLYINSRYQDILKAWPKRSPQQQLEGWVVTNTKFSSDAVKYGVCSGLKLLGWNYPERNNLARLVDKATLYPVTCLTTLTAKKKEMILNLGIVLCKDLGKDLTLLKKIFISEMRVNAISLEVADLCKAHANHGSMRNEQA